MELINLTNLTSSSGSNGYLVGGFPPYPSEKMME
jgi:hypothetical protein